jgi:hypothetical protein
MQFIVVCRQAADYLKPGYVYGYQCRVCGKQLQVGPTGVAAIGEGGVPLCNSCGFDFSERAAAAGLLDGVLVSASARQMAREIIEKMARKN